MKVTLTPSWELTNEHAASNYGQAVLVRRAIQEAIGPGDVIKAYPSWPLQRASQAVERMTRSGARFRDKERVFIQGFISFGE